MIVDCLDAHAPICESLGLVAKYFIDSRLDTFSTPPIIFICLSRATQGNKMAASGLF